MRGQSECSELTVSVCLPVCPCLPWWCWCVSTPPSACVCSSRSWPVKRTLSPPRLRSRRAVLPRDMHSLPKAPWHHGTMARRHRATVVPASTARGTEAEKRGAKYPRSGVRCQVSRAAGRVRGSHIMVCNNLPWAWLGGWGSVYRLVPGPGRVGAVRKRRYIKVDLEGCGGGVVPGWCLEPGSQPAASLIIVAGRRVLNSSVSSTHPSSPTLPVSIFSSSHLYPLEPGPAAESASSPSRSCTPLCSLSTLYLPPLSPSQTQNYL